MRAKFRAFLWWRTLRLALLVGDAEWRLTGGTNLYTLADFSARRHAMARGWLTRKR